MPVITCIEDLQQLAQRRVPRMFYKYADSGSWTESTYRANEADFAPILFRQRVMGNLEKRSTAVMMAELAKMPVAIAPVGLTGIVTVFSRLLRVLENHLDVARRQAEWEK
jgi:L-lactate dehydrogenase (cytochrome)/glycolate oxidase